MVEGAQSSRGMPDSTITSVELRLAHQHMIGRFLRRPAGNAETGAGIALRIEIDDQHRLADRRQRRTEIDGGRGLADPALLVGDRENPGAGRARERQIMLRHGKPPSPRE